MHPFGANARSSSRAKFKAMTGRASGGQVHSDESQDRKLFKTMIDAHERAELRAEGSKSKPRADKRARGGRLTRADGGKVKPLPIAPDYTGTGKRGADYLEELVKQSSQDAPVKKARGGRTEGKAGKVNVNIVIPQQGQPPNPPPALPGPPAAGLSPVPPGGGAPPPPMMRARGGRTGGDNGVGRIEKAAMQKKRPKLARGGRTGGDDGVGRLEKADSARAARKGRG